MATSESRRLRGVVRSFCDGAESASDMATRWRPHSLQPRKRGPSQNFDRALAGPYRAGFSVAGLGVVGIHSARAHLALPASAGDEPLGISRWLEAAACGGCARDFCAVLHAGSAHHAAIISGLPGSRPFTTSLRDQRPQLRLFRECPLRRRNRGTHLAHPKAPSALEISARIETCIRAANEPVAQRPGRGFSRRDLQTARRIRPVHATSESHSRSCDRESGCWRARRTAGSGACAGNALPFRKTKRNPASLRTESHSARGNRSRRELLLKVLRGRRALHPAYS